MTLPDLASIVLPGLVGFVLGSLLMAWHWYRTGVAPDAARIASLTASLDDAHREVSRLTGEKHALATQLHAVKEIVGGY